MYANFLLKRELNNKLAYGRIYSPVFPLHFHSHLEVYLIRSGEVEILVNDRRKVLHGGEMSIAFGYDAHGYRTVKESEVDYLIVPLCYCGDFPSLLTNRHSHSPFLDDPEVFGTVSDAFDKLYAAGTNELLRRG